MRHVLPPSEVVGMLFEEGEPVRGAPAFRGQWSKPGRYYWSRDGQHVPYESRFEKQHLMLLDYDRKNVTVVSQPFRVHFGRDQPPYSHVPDLFVRRADDTGGVLDIKGALAADREDNRLVFSLTAQICADAGLAYAIATEPDPVLLAKVTWLAGYRRQPLDVWDATPALLEAAADGADIGTVIGRAAERTGLFPLLVRPVLFHLMWRGDLSIPDGRLFEDDTPVLVCSGDPPQVRSAP